ncbi:3-isopropylmalate dehydratase small subunit [Sphingosinicella microcystinivorans]|uniref:3-isopropylmalate dehydratase small subunit n=1 Tax=Sphingosinicella microcystinivorans TaxID=335406 RepID=UPI0022F3A368|nr:3-isopropylmalate dehydratase small subunit [Sphingosinicella microcystinivorans]WBX85846.1 3-isopropylmalate dehydratase small subunit [Sphingosinicella microcystinivorans]
MAFEILVSPAARLPMADVDTDRILPAKRMKGLTRDGLGAFLFERMRYDDAGRERPEFVLNRPAFRDASVLVAGANFGCGSSREHAVWALRDHGIRCIIAPSFGSIFTNNCRENGILLIALPDAVLGALNARLDDTPTAPLSIDLRSQTILMDGGAPIRFSIDPSVRRHLMDGRDSVERTLALEGAIADYETRQAVERI